MVTVHLQLRKDSRTSWYQVAQNFHRVDWWRLFTEPRHSHLKLTEGVCTFRLKDAGACELR